MNNIFTINPDIEKRSVKALWYGGAKSQEIYAMLLNLEVEIDAFCMEEIKYDSFMGKNAINIFDLIKEGSYALLVDVDCYEGVMSKYGPYGLKEENVFVYINPQREFIYA